MILVQKMIEKHQVVQLLALVQLLEMEEGWSYRPTSPLSNY
jgi:hypothetical protein